VVQGKRGARKRAITKAPGAGASVPEPNSPTAGATPTKTFFVDMITKDIRLDDCILDLVDNSIDAARRTAAKKKGKKPYRGYWAEITFDKSQFTIADNCGGMTRIAAENYAFHFGRPAAASQLAVDHGIGLYGIGMKRAFLKMGREVDVRSSTTSEAFHVPINVDKWRENDTDKWDFELKPIDATSPGMTIAIKKLYDGISDELDRVTFPGELLQRIAMTYGHFLDKGFVVKVNGTAAKPIEFTLREGAHVKPARVKYKDEELPGVTVEIIAGMRAFPGVQETDESSASAERTAATLNGWFVACNDRVVVAADKSSKTGWGTGRGKTKIGVWHPQYNGFFGLVRLSSANPKELPWATTKRELDYESPLWRRALAKMIPITRSLTAYSNKRKTHTNEALPLEKGKSVRADVVRLRPEPVLPNLSTVRKSGRKKSVSVNIGYEVSRRRADRLGRELETENGDYDLIGKEAFDYAYRVLVGE
jgi:hypothetical protein